MANSSRQTRIKVRLFGADENDKPLEKLFFVDETLENVRLFVEEHCGISEITLMTSYPCKEFEEEEYSETLEALGLVPSALVVADVPIANDYIYQY